MCSRAVADALKPWYIWATRVHMVVKYCIDWRLWSSSTWRWKAFCMAARYMSGMAAASLFFKVRHTSRTTSPTCTDAHSVARLLQSNLQQFVYQYPTQQVFECWQHSKSAFDRTRLICFENTSPSFGLLQPWCAMQYRLGSNQLTAARMNFQCQTVIKLYNEVSAAYQAAEAC